MSGLRAAIGVGRHAIRAPDFSAREGSEWLCRKLALAYSSSLGSNMHIDERSVTDACSGMQPGASEVGWFAARQPGIVRFLEERLLLPDGDAFAVALEGAWQIWAVFRSRDGVPPSRVERSLLERAEHALLREAHSGWSIEDGCAHRQPALCRWLEAFVANPAVPLTNEEALRVGMALAAVIYSLDELTTGRQVP